MKFVDVKNDVAFKKIFGSENQTSILISFLNAVLHLEGSERIGSISIGNPFQFPLLLNYKASILDLKATDLLGRTFIVEMQVADVDGMDKRLLYYTSKEYSRQIVSPEKYTELRPVIFIGIFDFKFTQGQHYFSHHTICDVETKEQVIKDMDFYFIELKKFLKPATECKTIIDKWIFFIKEAENLAVVPENLDDEGLSDAYKFANKSTWTREELDAYENMAMREQDERGRLSLAVRVAEEKGKVEGKEELLTEMVIEMHKNGLPIERIAKITKISVEQVLEIIKKHT
jgi:predicted transposase/invertase (TIGR01784 family)